MAGGQDVVRLVGTDVLADEAVDGIAASVVVAAKVVGIVLVSAFLVIPAASARLVSRRFLQMTIVSLLLGAGTAVVGVFASYYLDAPSGATIILTQTAAFLVCLIGSAFAGRLAGKRCPDSS